MIEFLIEVFFKKKKIVCCGCYKTFSMQINYIYLIFHVMFYKIACNTGQNKTIKSILEKGNNSIPY